jgi:cytochrome P450
MSDPGILRPAQRDLAGRLQALFMARYPAVFGFARDVWPIPRWPGKFYLVTRYDDVRDVFLNDPAFKVPYEENLDLIMGGEKFFLGMGNTETYRHDTAAMRAVVKASDLPVLQAAAEAEATRLLDAAGGRLEMVDFSRAVTFGVLCPYFGITPPAEGDLRVWATRLFEFQFTHSGKPADPAKDPLYADASCMAPLLRAHVNGLIAARREGGGADDVLSRCLALQKAGEPGYEDAKICCALIGFLVGGLPQPPMVLPQALEQLLRRSGPMNAAMAAAKAGDGAVVARYLFEALRFDPLAPLLQRKAVQTALIAAGTPHETRVPAGATVSVSFASAMRDPRRVADPEVFNPDRPACDYMHFGYGLHSCFGEQINRVLLPAMLEKLLQRGIRRARGPEGRLIKRGIFADTLWVEFAA